MTCEGCGKTLIEALGEREYCAACMRIVNAARKVWRAAAALDEIGRERAAMKLRAYAASIYPSVRPAGDGSRARSALRRARDQQTGNGGGREPV